MKGRLIWVNQAERHNSLKYRMSYSNFSKDCSILIFNNSTEGSVSESSRKKSPFFVIVSSASFETNSNFELYIKYLFGKCSHLCYVEKEESKINFCPPLILPSEEYSLLCMSTCKCLFWIKLITLWMQQKGNFNTMTDQFKDCIFWYLHFSVRGWAWERLASEKYLI